MRRLFAVFFFILLLAEWGLHGVNNPGTSPVDEQTIAADQEDHDDPCRTLIVCSDSQRKDRQMPGYGHQVMHVGLLDLLSGFRSLVGVRDDPLILFATAHCLFRPPSPPFRPPEHS